MLLCVCLTGGGVSGVGSSAAARVGGVPQKQPAVPGGGDRYAALAELDTVFSSPPPATSYNTTSTSKG